MYSVEVRQVVLSYMIGIEIDISSPILQMIVNDGFS